MITASYPQRPLKTAFLGVCLGVVMMSYAFFVRAVEPNEFWYGGERTGTMSYVESYKYDSNEKLTIFLSYASESEYQWTTLYWQNFYDVSDFRYIAFNTSYNVAFGNFECDSDQKETANDAWGTSRSWCIMPKGTSVFWLMPQRIQYGGDFISHTGGLTKTEIDAKWGTDFLESGQGLTNTQVMARVEDRVYYEDSIYIYHASIWPYPLNFPYGGCALTKCNLCETSDTCIDAGCFWEYSLYYLQIDPNATGYYCAEPYEPAEEQCGAFFKCQYCGAQATCEEQLNCEWINRGQGSKCYMKEPTMPPPPATWEVPTLDDCEELSGAEKWLCEIKNFIAGIFMPSQEKVNALFDTFGAFKDKFPFSYIGAVNSFFGEISTSLDTEKGIPIKILGNEGNVDFSFWDSSAEIGGISETFKNVVFDATTILVIFGFFMWIVGFIKRFFM